MKSMPNFLRARVKSSSNRYQFALAGFTLAELLIVLIILAEIATFTIPKILLAQQYARQSSLAKEAMSNLAAAFQLYQAKDGITTGMSTSSLLKYLNYVSIDSVSSLDDVPTGNNLFPCSNSNLVCLRLYGGGILVLGKEILTSTASNYAIQASFDPDGIRTGTASDGPGKAIVFVIYATGRVTTWGNVDSNTYMWNGGGPYSSNAAVDPAWFR